VTICDCMSSSLEELIALLAVALSMPAVVASDEVGKAVLPDDLT
jgi:hypothetical protein